MNRLERISILLGDVALPLIGYVFWKWNFYFILLFFILDQASRVIFLPWRLKLTSLTSKEKNQLIFRHLLQFLIEVLLVHSVIFLQNKEINFLNEIQAFLTYEDMGIQQGFLLIPLILASEWMRIKNELKTGIIESKQVSLQLQNQKSSFIRIAFFALLAGLMNLVSLPEWSLVGLFLALLSFLVVFNKNEI